MLKILKKGVLFYLCFCMFSAFSVTSTYATENRPSITGKADFSEAYKILNKVNSLRKSVGAKELVMDQSLQNMAMLRAAECSVFYSHTRPNYTSCFSVYDEFNYSSSFMAENIAIGYETVEDVYNAWENSAGHYSNMISNNFTAIGIGCFYQKNGTKTWVQLFSDSRATNYKRQSIDTKTFSLSIDEQLMYELPEQTHVMNKGDKSIIDTSMINLAFPYATFQLDKNSFVYTSSNNDIVSPNTNGVLTAKKAGSAKIKVILKGTSLSREFTASVILPSTPFIDIPETAWYSETIKQVYDSGLMKGIDDMHFSPNGKMSRGMVATVLYRIAGEPYVNYQKKFSDVPSNKYYSKAITWAANQGVINGYKNGKFGPSDNITREQLATVVRSLASKNGVNTKSTNNLTSFKDYKNVSRYAKGAFAWAVDKKIISGAQNGTKLNPKLHATRAECAKVFLQAQRTIYK